MSTFSGRFSEDRFKNICIDNFGPHNYDCTAFFLSHYHSDHMRGIYEPTFHSLFERKRPIFYCHEITKQFIVKCNDIRIPEYKIRTIDKLGTDIEIEEDLWIRVYSLPAGHCPGSVMFLLDGVGKRVLYSGDIRVPLSDLVHLDALHTNHELLPIDSLYLDTTFASSRYLTFPSRHDSLKSMCSHIDTWLAKDSNNRVCILSTACIGIEFLMVELSRLYNKVHVSQDAFGRFLCAIEMLCQVTTTEPDQAKIHFCSVSKCEVCFRSIYNNDDLLVVKPSALYFTQDILHKHGPVVYDSARKILRVCYSSHYSCDELVEFVRYLKPKKIYPCVVPPRRKNENSYQQFFDDFLEKCGMKVGDDDESDGCSSLCSDQELDQFNQLNDSEIFIEVVSGYLMRPVERAQRPNVDKTEVIRSLDMQTPT